MSEESNDHISKEYENPSENRVWYDYGNEFRLKEKAVQLDKLERAVYTIHQDLFGFYLEKENDEFTFDYKLYGLETKLVNRVLKSYHGKGTGNLGVLLNGLKGTGKSVSAKIISNKLNLPVILISKEIKNCHFFINSIPQNIVVFIDEYEKIFGQSSEMLTIMDGALNSDYRRVFLLTTNELTVDRNLIERPSRIRYLKKFSDLSPVIVAEIVDDILEHKELRESCIKFISSLETITVDIVKSVLEEVNIHHEAPEEFADMFNVKKLTGKFDIDVQGSDGTFTSVIKNAKLNVRPLFKEQHIGYNFSINDEYIGNVKEIISSNIIVIEPFDKDGKGKKDDRTLKVPITIRVENAEIAHYSYTYGYGDGMMPTTRKVHQPKTDAKNINELSRLLGDTRGVSDEWLDEDID
jgi:DNA-directed RNA polymerase subunit F